MDSELIESIAEATDVPLSAIGQVRLRADDYVHQFQQDLWSRWDQSKRPVREAWAGQVIDARRYCGCMILSRDPPVLLVHIGGTRPLWMAESLSSFLADRPVLFLLLIYWSVESPGAAEFIRKNAARHRARFPKHSLVFLGNTPDEVRYLQAAGLEAIFFNHNLLVSEDRFRPLPNQSVQFDAVYNARIARFKRHYLAASIERVLHVAYRCPYEMSRQAGRAYVQRMLARSPGHRFANKLARGLPLRLTPDEVNGAYNQAAVGLCLSPFEGAMYASMEYMLAGLPIVNTPNRGGRDVFFDPDYCVTVEPDPAAIRNAVVALREKAIPRDHVRQRTLERVAAARQQGQPLVEAVLARHAPGLQANIWPPKPLAIKFQPARSHIADFFTPPPPDVFRCGG